MRLIIEIECDNAAFDDPDELPSILGVLASNLQLSHQGLADVLRLTGATSDGVILPHPRDSNGNTVGSVRVVEA